jgi:hypothetical protein
MYQAYLTNFLTSGSGALGSFTGSDAGPLFVANPVGVLPVPCAGLDSNYVAFGADQINIHRCQGFVPTPIAPDLGGVDLYSCSTTTCAKDFSPATVPGVGLFLYGAVDYKVTAIEPVTTPEPAALNLLLCGIVLLAALGVVPKGRVGRKITILSS